MGNVCVMKNMSIKSLSLVIISFIVIYGAFVIYSAMTISRNTGEAEQFWTKYQDISSTRASAYNSIVNAMGYGEMIHLFKNYVLRKDQKLIAKIRTSIGKVHAAIDQYDKAAISPTERSALRDIRGVVKAFEKNIETARDMIEQGYSSRQIDKVVKVDDEPAITAIAALRSAVKSHKLQGKETTSRIELLGEFHNALGFGGINHHFQNYVLRQEAELIQKLKQSIAALQSSVDLYRSFSLVPAEDLALSRLTDIMKTYEHNLTLAIQLAGRSKAPEEIDWLVKVDDKPALSALRVLHIEISKKIESSKDRTTSQLASTTSLSQSIFIASAVGLALLILLISYVLFSHVIGPINKISATLERFIDGDLTIDFHGAERRDELGYMVEVIDKMRVILINYAMRKSGAVK